MVRVIAGEFKSRRLMTLPGIDTRPTSDRLKETLFDILQSRISAGQFLDCFAGSGAIGIEALSRGAAFVVLIESLPEATGVIRTNLRALGHEVSPRVELLRHRVDVALKILGRRKKKFDIVFLDPPYAAEKEYLQVFMAVQNYELLGPGALVVAQHSKFIPLVGRQGSLARIRAVRQGDSILSLFEMRE